MASISNIQDLMQAINKVASYLTDEEMQDIFKIYKKALNRIKEENKVNKHTLD